MGADDSGVTPCQIRRFSISRVGNRPYWLFSFAIEHDHFVQIWHTPLQLCRIFVILLQRGSSLPLLSRFRVQWRIVVREKLNFLSRRWAVDKSNSLLRLFSQLFFEVLKGFYSFINLNAFNMYYIRFCRTSRGFPYFYHTFYDYVTQIFCMLSLGMSIVYHRFPMICSNHTHVPCTYVFFSIDIEIYHFWSGLYKNLLI